MSRVSYHLLAMIVVFGVSGLFDVAGLARVPRILVAVVVGLWWYRSTRDIVLW